MSEYINNREYRQKALKELIMELHKGKKPEEVKAKFQELFEGVAASEIAEMEQNLIMEGMPVEEVQRLCDVHAAFFKGSIEDIHKPSPLTEIPGHPLNTFKIENEALEKYIEGTVKKNIERFKQDNSTANKNALLHDFNTLWDVDKHYSRKENLLFPYLEKYGITAPPKVMWGVDDEIRAAIKEVRSLLNTQAPPKETVQKAEEAVTKILDMIFKETNILFPMAQDTLSEDEWLEIEKESDDIGYCLVGPKKKWSPVRVDVRAKEEQQNPKGYLKLDTGILSSQEINEILKTLPIDITFVDKDDIVKYFSQGKERIFARTKAVIGRNVQNCHPPGSVTVVKKMLEDFKAGNKDSEEFWLRLGEVYVYIRYFAVRDENGNYLGTLEVTQNIQPIQEIKGEKRLLSD
ncbi:MAG TPA: DUF438 domain-containing protein [Peptococcaceae bacterium]|nr:DUF438 domain-containing protein [Peptococcaceae bacterium]